jgi:hypothetical protein
MPSSTNALQGTLPGIQRLALESFIWWCAGFPTFYARGQTGQQLLLGAYQALAAGVEELPASDDQMLDLVVDGVAKGL